jgi:hypothetical protein
MARGVDRRLAGLERFYGENSPDEDRDKELHRAIFCDILDETASLKSMGARHCSRGGKPIQPRDEVGETLGYPYTHGQAEELTVRRVFERYQLEGRFPPEQAEQLTEQWIQNFKELDARYGSAWDEVAATGPPQPNEDGL